jgi:hypothetical protein
MKLVSCFVLIVTLASADTITFTDGSFVNATVSYDKVERVFRLEGKVKGQSQKFDAVAAELVKTVRFNSLDNNGEAPPALPHPRGASAADTMCDVTLETGTTANGVLQEIDKNSVRLAGKDLPRETVTVLRVRHKK